MHIPVKGIQARPGGRVTVEFIRPIGRLDEDIDVLGPIHLKVTATNLGGRIGLEGYVRARVALTCSRSRTNTYWSSTSPYGNFT